MQQQLIISLVMEALAQHPGFEEPRCRAAAAADDDDDAPAAATAAFRRRHCIHPHLPFPGCPQQRLGGCG